MNLGDPHNRIDQVADEILDIRQKASKRQQSIANRHAHLLRRVTDLEERVGEMEALCDELKHQLLQSPPEQPHPRGRTPGRNGTKERGVHPAAELQSGTDA